MQGEPEVIDFEKSLEELNDIASQMEQGNLTLEESLKQFERGITLTRLCQTALKNAEQKVRILTEDNETLKNFQTPTQES